MSLESAIEANTCVLRELLARLSSGAIVAAPMAEAPAKKPVSAASGPTTAQAVVADAPASTTKESAPAAASAVAESPASTAADKPVTYDQVSKAITDGVKLNRENVLTVLAQFGVKKGPELTADQYGPFIKALS